MTPAEIVAYNRGVEAVLALARATSVALAPRLSKQPTRINFAMGALDGLAEEGRALLMLIPPHGATPAEPTASSNSVVPGEASRIL